MHDPFKEIQQSGGNADMPRSLEGIRVIDLSHVLAAPTTTMILADLGAEVIHVEPPHGDDAREFGPFAGKVDKNLSGYFISLNRNKKGIVLNLKHQKAKDILIEMIKKADVVVENFRPTTMKKMKLHFEDLKKINPGIVYCSICGFGHDSLPEYAERPSYDMVAQAYSGLMSITGPEGGPPAGWAPPWVTSSRGCRPPSASWRPCATGRRRAGASMSTSP
jgi:CoA:oxalate CoA-transferase